jgi:nucleotide-binding universal stress UspA family protein
MFKHILVPTDGSQFSQDAVRRAVSFAKEAGASITAFYAMRQPREHIYIGGEEINLHSPWEGDKDEKNQARIILDFVENLCREAGVICNRVTSANSIVYEAIIQAAIINKCDLIFMASHGRRGLSALLLGSETHKVLTHSKIPVLVCR